MSRNCVQTYSLITRKNKTDNHGKGQIKKEKKN